MVSGFCRLSCDEATPAQACCGVLPEPVRPARFEGRPMVYEPLARPTAQGLYDPAYERDACVVGFVARLDGVASHDIVEKGLEVLRNLDHRGATGADTAAGDGAGILVQVPDTFLRKVVDVELPAKGSYAVGMAFMPTESHAREAVKAALTHIAVQEGLRVLGWRSVPTETSTLSPV